MRRSARAFAIADLRREGLRDAVYRAIRQQITLGRLQPGDRLTEVMVAESLAVSRTPVREGLAALAREGLLVRAGRTYVLPSMTQDDINEVMEMRCLLEPKAIGRATESARASDLAELSQALLDQKTAHANNDAGAFITANEHFRGVLLALVPNRRLRQSMALYNDHLNFLRVRLDRAHWRKIVIRNLQALVLAIRNGDAKGAEAVWLRHIEDSDAAARDWLREVRDRSLADVPRTLAAAKRVA